MIHLANPKKKFNDWSRNQNGSELLAEVAVSTGYPVCELLVTPKGLPNKLRGTYAHPDLVPHIASWASPKFAVKVSKIVNEYFTREAIRVQKELLGEKDDKIDELNSKVDQLLDGNIELRLGNESLAKQNKKMDHRIKRLLSQNGDLYELNLDVSHKVEHISNDRVVSTGDAINDHLLVIIKNNIDEEEYDDDELCYEYHALRVMRKSLKARLSNHNTRYPDMKILTEIAYSPNSMNLWTRIKKQLGTGKKKKLMIDNCKFNLKKNYTEKQLIKDIKAIHNERFDTIDI